jgi:CBS domain-containing protein
MVVCAKDFMTKEVVTIEATKSALDAAKLMTEREVGSLVVLEGKNPVGIVTDRDVVTKAVAKDLQLRGVKVREIMSKPLVTVKLDTPMIDIARLMDDRGIRRVPVVRGGDVVGIVTSSDMGRASKILAPYLLPRIPEIYLTPKKPIK